MYDVRVAMYDLKKKKNVENVQFNEKRNGHVVVISNLTSLFFSIIQLLNHPVTKSFHHGKRS